MSAVASHPRGAFLLWIRDRLGALWDALIACYLICGFCYVVLKRDEQHGLGTACSSALHPAKLSLPLLFVDHLCCRLLPCILAVFLFFPLGCV